MDCSRWIVFCIVISSSLALNLESCSEALGMQSGKIPDASITSSSSYDTSVGPKSARIHTEIDGGAWCPKEQVAKDVDKEFLQVDLGSLKVVRLVETQGRFGNGQGVEFAEQYSLEYQRQQNGPWFRFRNRNGQQLFQGNTNTYIAEVREVDPPIIARTVRFIPYSVQPRTVCMRVELYGCPWYDEVVSYTTRQGDSRGIGVNLLDFTYDGEIANRTLSGGLGQLTDGRLGDRNFRLAPAGLPYKGYEWVGWKNETGVPVRLTFYFSGVRNFSQMLIHSNNLFNKEVRVFRRAVIRFSIGGRFYSDDAVEFNYMPDSLIEFDRSVEISLGNYVGQTLEVSLYHGAKWLLISEVSFQSSLVASPPPSETGPPSADSSRTLSAVQTVIGLTSAPPRSQAAEVDGAYESAVVTDRSPSQRGQGAASRDSKDTAYVGYVIGALAACVLVLFVVIFLIVMRHRRRKHNNGNNNNHRNLKILQPGHETDLYSSNTLGMTGTFNTKLGNVYNGLTVYNGSVISGEEASPAKRSLISDYGTHGDIQHRKLPELPSGSSTGITDYAVPEQNGPPAYATYGRNPTPYAAADVLNLPLLSGTMSGTMSGTTAVYSSPALDVMSEDSLMRIPPDSLKLVEKLGDGNFGEIHLCEAPALDAPQLATHSTSLVTLKILRPSSDDHVRQEFWKEVRIMQALRDVNIVQVLGVCSDDRQTVAIVSEYARFGDLHSFLKSHVLEGDPNRDKYPDILSYGCLIHMATQIASGMKYLESLNMVHRDLAARNCIVGANYHVKICDLGMTRPTHAADYYRVENRALLPVRWMAWEGVLMGKFSTKSDVWSFGVTLWEMLTLARERPYSALSDEDVIALCGRHYRQEQPVVLGQPPIAHRELYDLMCECWNRECVNRPSFREMHMFLQRKNIGYEPKDDPALAKSRIICTTPVSPRLV